MNKILKRCLIGALLIAILSTISYCGAPYDTETTQHITLRKTITGSGFIIRNETPVTQSANGVFEPSIKDGVRVSKGNSVGVSISGNINSDLVAKLTEITKRIEEIEEADSFSELYASDEARIFLALKELTASIRMSASNEDFDSAARDSLRLSALLKKKASVENGSVEDKLLIDLKKQKYELEQQLGGIREDIKAPASGYFFRHTDGLENCGTEEEIASMSLAKVNNLSQIMQNYLPERNCVAKIVDTYVWYLVAAIPYEEAEKLTQGNKVKISVDDSVDVEGSVLSINHKDGEDEASIVIKSTRNLPDIYEKRTAEFEICYEEYSGLYVPAAAIRVVDNVTGVYVLNKSESVVFRCVDVIWQEENYYIVKSNYTPPEGVKYSPLKLYDDVLVNPEAVN